jgi:hypothetical protein
MSWLAAFRRRKQAVKSALRRLCGRPQPTTADCAAARARVAAGLPDPADPGRDRCLARGYCCETGCRSCPWGHRRRG